MAKTIKFNLICDGNPVRTIEDLQNNFSIEDILNYFNNGLLHRWLNVRNYNDELKAVSDINDSDPIQITQKLIKIFNIDIEENKVEESVYMLKYLNDRKEAFSQYEKDKFKVGKIIDNYHAEYEQLVKRIIDAPYNAAYIKTTIAEISDNYFWIFEHDYRRLFYEFHHKSLVAVFLLLANEKTRYFFMPIKLEKEDNKEEIAKYDKLSFGSLEEQNAFTSKYTRPFIKSIISEGNTEESDSKEIKYDIDLPELSDKKRMYDCIIRNLGEKNLNLFLKENLKSCSKHTDGYWDEIEPKGKKYMILRMERNDFVRSQGVSGEDSKYAYDDVFNKFIILDGIDYKSNDDSHKLLYMEV